MKLNRKQATAMGIDVPPVVRKKAKVTEDRRLRDRLFLEGCKAHGLPLPDPEVQFHPERKWRLDWVFEGYLALEIQGGVWQQGHHSRGQDQIDDMAKFNEAQLLGYVVLLVTSQQVESGEAFALVKRALTVPYEELP